MNWDQYLQLFDQIIDKKYTEAPYDNEAYYTYTQLNRSRTHRWLKKNPLTDVMTETLQSIDAPQEWILITEPWCGDAAHSTPIIKLMADTNDLIDLKIDLRDSSDMIDSYLTNGGKSIPKLIVRDADGNDIFDWGPRPKEAQELHRTLKERNAPFEELNQELQQWYNKNKAQDIQEELASIIKRVGITEENPS